MKRCSKCRADKPLMSFYKNDRAPDGRRGDCKACVLSDRRARYERDPVTLKDRVAVYQADHAEVIAERRVADPVEYKRRNRTAQLRRYGLTQETYDEMFDNQGGLCAICRTADSGPHWSIDHDHVTGEVRGILCWHCNVALGHFRDDPVALISAADYLMRTFAKESINEFQ